MIQKTDIEKLQRFINGTSDDQEKRYIYSLFAENEENNEFKKYIEQEFSTYLTDHPDEDHNLEYLLDRIHHSINKKESQNKANVVHRIYKWYSVAAAVLLIPMLIVSAIWIVTKNNQGLWLSENSAISTLVAPLGSRINFSLPDGTVGWLNSGSSLEYHLPFSENRQIELSGEAWFDVIHDADHPFEISSGDSKVKVLGTKFNFSAYPGEKYMEVVLEEGKVQFSTSGLASGVEMNPNERLVLREGAINIDVTDASKYSAWKEGKLVFRGDSMDEVARRIGRWYNVTVELVDKELQNYTFRGTFEDDSLNEVLKYLTMTSPIRFEVMERKLQDDGTLQKQKVLLYKKR